MNKTLIKILNVKILKKATRASGGRMTFVGAGAAATIWPSSPLSARPSSVMLSLRARLAMAALLASATYFTSLPLSVAANAAAPTTTLTLLQFNILNAGAGLEKPVPQAFEQTIKIFKASKAEVIAVSEVRADSTDEKNPGPTGPSIAEKLAKAMGYYFYDQSAFYDADNARTGQHPAIWANAILSKYPIEKGTPLGLGASINIGGRHIYVFSLNLDYKPYPPYQMNNIAYEGAPFIKTEAEAIKYANIAHKAAMDELTGEIKKEAKHADAVFVLGDFNEPSFRDWTKRAADSNVQTAKVEWPSSKRLEKMGFVDTYRVINPDEVAKPGLTWTPTTAENDPEDHHDRIDFVFARAKHLKVLSSKVLGEKPERADIVISPWPSDHRAVVSTVKF